ncbi:MAG: methyltransferase domain-containing protein, partial [Deltaproteobacteria bacterium]|nr:methyltransferase domain-containing protein [Deltaproteobacteria bacterium]
MAPGNVEESALQQEHYDRIGTDYESHYGDAASMAYRDRFIHEPLLGSLPLAGRDVLDAMCGSGQTTGWLLSRGARVTGLDVSPGRTESYARKWPRCAVHTASVLAMPFARESFDAVVIIGGLHHLHPHVDRGVAEILRVLKPGGFFCFMEPHAGSVPDRVRRLWYRVDPLFGEGEQAVDLAALEARW